MKIAKKVTGIIFELSFYVRMTEYIVSPQIHIVKNFVIISKVYYILLSQKIGNILK